MSDLHLHIVIDVTASCGADETPNMAAAEVAGTLRRGGWVVLESEAIPPAVTIRVIRDEVAK